MQEWNEVITPPRAPNAKEGAADLREEQINTENFGWYFQQCAENRELLNSIEVVVPVRPADGTNNKLARMLSIWYGEGTPWSHLNDHMGGYIEATRANIAYTFKHGSGAKYLLMIDNDMEPPINLPYLLARHDKPIVGSPALSVHQIYGPQLCFSVKAEDGTWRFPTISSKLPIPAKGLKEVGHVGTGALLIRRDVIDSFRFAIYCTKCGNDVGDFETFPICKTCNSVEHLVDDIPFQVPIAYRIKGMETGRLRVGEDISFCNQARAKGFKMYVDLEAHCGHRKMVGLQWDESLMDENMDVNEWTLPSYGHILYTR